MTHAPVPTRAEVTDIARAIAEGTSALMLSAETSTGEHPELVVATMASIIGEVEGRRERAPREMPARSDSRAALVRAADELAHDLDTDTLIIPTDTGQSARYAAALSRQHIIALSPSSRVRRQLALEYGVRTLPWDGDHGHSLPATVATRARDMGYVSAGDPVIVCWGQFSYPHAHLIASLVVPGPETNSAASADTDAP